MDASNQGRHDPTRVLDFFAHTTAATFSALPSHGKPGAAEADDQRSGAKRSVTRASASNRIASHYSLPAAALRLQGGVAVDPHRPSSLPQLKGAQRSTPGGGHQQLLVMGFHESIAAVAELVSAALVPDADVARARSTRGLVFPGGALPPPPLAAPGIPRRRPVLTFGGGGSNSPRRGSVVGDSYRTEAPPDPAPPPPAPALRCAHVQLRMERFLADEGAVPAGAAAPFNGVVFAAASARAKAVGLRGLPPLPLSKVRRR